MIYKESIDHLLKEGEVKNCPIELKTVEKLIDRARIDLKTAQRNLKEDEECAFIYSYNAMLRAGLALMLSEGFRPETSDKHKTVVRFVNSVFGKEHFKVITNYDLIRRKRHRFIYEPDIPCSAREAEEALPMAKEFLIIILQFIRNKNPQLEFSFDE